MQFKTRDGTAVKDGEAATLVLMYDHEEVTATGTVRVFEQVERVYDGEGIAVGTTSKTCWELVTDDPNYPAIGFRPENVKTKSE